MHEHGTNGIKLEVVLRLSTPFLIVHVLERSWYQARHAWLLHIAFSSFAVCFLRALCTSNISLVVASNLVSLYDPFFGQSAGKFTLRVRITPLFAFHSVPDVVWSCYK